MQITTVGLDLAKNSNVFQVHGAASLPRSRLNEPARCDRRLLRLEPHRQQRRFWRGRCPGFPQTRSTPREQRVGVTETRFCIGALFITASKSDRYSATNKQRLSRDETRLS